MHFLSNRCQKAPLHDKNKLQCGILDFLDINQLQCTGQKKLKLERENKTRFMKLVDGFIVPIRHLTIIRQKLQKKSILDLRDTIRQ